MGKPSVEQLIRSAVAEQMACLEEFVTDDTLLIDDLGMDDLDAADLALGLEELWPGIPWTEDMDLNLLVSLRTFKSLVGYVEDLLP